MILLRRRGVGSWFTPATIYTSAILLALTSAVFSVNVNLPEDFQQCQPAIIGFSQSKGNLSILIREDGVKAPLINVTLPSNTTSWTWPTVNVSAGDNITILVTDRSTKRKSLSQLMIDPSTTNDTSCLPTTTAGHHKSKANNQTPGDGGYDNGINGIGGIDSPQQSQDHHKMKITEVSVIAGVLGGLLFALLSLILIMCWRRRREAKIQTFDDTSKDTITAHRIGEMGERLDRHRVVTLFSEDGRAEGQAILGREGDAGWSYMSRLAPGLEMTPNTEDFSTSRSRNGGRRGAKTRRYDNESKDGDLPSYKLSEYEKKALPKYADEGDEAIAMGSAMVLTTRHDSQGSRLTFSPDTVDTNGIPTTPRQSTRTYQASNRRGEEDDEEVIVFRPVSGRSLLPYERNDADQESVYSNISQQEPRSHALEASSTSIQSHPTADYNGHRRSRSEISLRRNYPSISPFS